MPQHIVIVGGGVGGTIVANLLARSLHRQHLAIMRQRGIVRTQRQGTEIHYSLADPRILEACRITRDVLLQQLTQQASLAVPVPRAEGV